MLLSFSPSYPRLRLVKNCSTSFPLNSSPSDGLSFAPSSDFGHARQPLPRLLALHQWVYTARF